MLIGPAVMTKKDVVALC